MDTVVLDGIKYVKASVAAKDFRYTSDYLGQLCRGKKIDARLVGRTWFVNPESIREHKNNKHQKRTAGSNESPDITEATLSVSTDIPIKTKPERKFVAPVMTSKTAKQIAMTTSNSNEDNDRSRKLIVWYESDQEMLIPKLTRKTSVSKTIRIEPAGAKKVRVTNGGRKKITSFSPSVLPEVALSGKLTISSFPDKMSVLEDSGESNLDENSPENKDISSKQDKKAIEPKETSLEQTVNKTTDVERVSPEVKKKIASNPVAMRTSSKPKKPAVSASKQADKGQVLVPPVSFAPESVGTQVEVPISLLVRISPLIATFVAFACVLLIFSASNLVVASNSFYESGVVLQVANLFEIFNQTSLSF